MIVADAIRRVTARMQKEIDEGRRSGPIDGDDLLDILLAIADELDPPLDGDFGNTDTA